jgi:hypothetical protein
MPLCPLSSLSLVLLQVIVLSLPLMSHLITSSFFILPFCSRLIWNSHYDVEINPVVKVANQKKPRQLLWAIWLQLCQEVTGANKKSIDAGVFDQQ